MPQVPTYRRQQTVQAAPTQRRSLYPSPPQLETPLVRQPQTQGAYAQLGNAIAQLGMTRYGQELQKQDDIRLTSAERQLSDWELQTLYDPKTGALNVQGEQAFGLPEKVGESYDKNVENIRTGLSNDRQKLRFEQISNQRKASVMGRIDTHVAQQTEKVDGEETNNYIKNEQSLAAHNALTPDAVGVSIDNQRRKITEYGQRHGWGPEQTKAAVEDATSKTHLQVIDRMVANGADIQAREYFKVVKPEIEGGELARIEKSLNEGNKLGDSQRAADSIWKSTQSTGEPFTLQYLMDEAAKVEDSETRQAVESRLNSYYRVYKNDESEKEQTLAKAAKEAADAQQTLIDQFVLNTENKLDAGLAEDAMRKMPGWSSLPDNVRKALITYANTLGKPEGGAARKTNQRVWYDRYQEAATDPAKFAKRNLMLDINELSDSDFQELAKLQGETRKPKPAKEATELVDNFRSKDQIISAALRRMNVDTTKKEGKDAEDRLWEATEIQVRNLERQTNKKATNDDIQVIVDDLLIEQGAKKGSWWNILPGGEPFFDQPGKRKLDTLTDRSQPPEPTAVNPKTGERVVLRNGQWVRP